MIPTGLLVKLGLYAGAVAAVLLALWYVHSSIDEKGYQRGLREVAAAYQKRDKDALAAAEKKVKELAAEKAAVEARWRADSAAAELKLTREKRNAEKALADFNARLASGFRLQDPGARGPAAGCDRGVPGAAASAGSGSGTSRTELPEPPVGVLSAEASGFLAAEASRADQVVLQLKACQALVAQP